MTYAIAFFAGHPQTFLYVSYVILAWIIVLLAGTARRGRVGIHWWRLLLWVAGFYLLFLALSAAQWWPSLEFTALSVRANVDYAFVSGGFPLQDTWQLLFPGVLTWFSPLYVSITGLALALLSLWPVLDPAGDDGSTVVSGRAIVLFFLGLTLFGLLVSYGGNGFLYPFVYHYLPGWNLFRSQERAAYLVAFGLAVLAGFGMAGLERAPRKPMNRVLILFAITVVLGAIVFGMGWQRQGRSAIGSGEFIWIAGKAITFALVLTIILWRKRPLSRAASLLVLLIVLDLLFANFTTNLTGATLEERSALAPEVVALQNAIEEDSASGSGVPGRAYNEYRVDLNYGMRAQVEDTWGSSPLRLARYDRLFQEFPLDRLWQLSGVGHVLTWRREHFVPGELLAEYPQETDTTYLHRLAAANPRAWIASSVEWADDADAAERLADHGFDLSTNAILPPDSSLPDGVLAPPGQNSVALQRLSPERLLVQISSENGGLLIVSENWMPGWEAMLRERDTEPGIPLEVLRANLTWLGMPIPAGDYAIELAYRPASVRYGLWISLAAWALLLGLMLWWGLWRKEGT